MMELILIMILFGLFSFVLNRKHMLMVLLSLEFLVVVVFFLLVLCFVGFEGEKIFLMIFLTFSVCEGVVGLSILVSLIRMYGNDYFQSFNVLW
uniref:NADH-ubiquinone oxidoreductase chain 4L n=1 Tax=Crypsis chinensis TaxID=2984370 RepID=A0A978AWE9_9CUCU|nr:NADH dehydrogenase subunit 4L [Crypsis chinensis]UYB79091.1 NADH dehydrogenase subunit 4L [Crypsis chinensis]